MDHKLAPLKTIDFDLFYHLMKRSFPSAEFRPRSKERQLLNQANFTVLTRYDLSGKKIDGFIAEWSFSDFLFLEHIAVDPNLRGHGIGSKMLCNYLEQAKKPVLIEVEAPTTDLAVRRIRFYKRLGFSLSSFGYVQPDLGQAGDHIDLLLMQYPNLLTEDKFKQRKKEIFQSVYGGES
ncbi:GNAT family N-acetyltransferase [Sporolactobacillus shoreicorticis]|uniref:GNAT family N-acetyltransferase n=1 Tax=Sporolactobacillus shoreicorticis TaxID=1923877 RepID=A0ABW5RYI2_9BACL|nr:GNAT family N-acetyltransferase [Sporolactobacillus shoreicorticis]MCO7124970.1 GNAT family N-acetyltransferase [Sporolactobacillus shoreicorticis]